MNESQENVYTVVAPSVFAAGWTSFTQNDTGSRTRWFKRVEEPWIVSLTLDLDKHPDGWLMIDWNDHQVLLTAYSQVPTPQVALKIMHYVTLHPDHPEAID